MNTFLHRCPLIASVIASAAVVALVLGIKAVIPADVTIEAGDPLASGSSVSSAVATAASAPEPQSVPLSVPTSSSLQTSSAVSKPSAPSSTPASSAQSKAPSSKPASSAQSKAPAASSKAAPPSRTGNSLLRPVDRDYFDDALFIGDSLTEDLKNYGGLDNASYFCRVGLNIYALFERPKTSSLSGLTLEKTLRGHQYQKIYVMLGINELGTVTTKYFVKHYSQALTKIRELQPDAIIYVQSILPVTAKKSQSDPVFKNSTIRERNAGLQTLENGQNIFYLDVAQSVSDQNGDLCAGYTGDNVHLKAKYYPLWAKYLLANGVSYDDAVFS